VNKSHIQNTSKQKVSSSLFLHHLSQQQQHPPPPPQREEEKKKKKKANKRSSRGKRKSAEISTASSSSAAAGGGGGGESSSGEQQGGGGGAASESEADGGSGGAPVAKKAKVPLFNEEGNIVFNNIADGQVAIPPSACILGNSYKTFSKDEWKASGRDGKPGYRIDASGKKIPKGFCVTSSQVRETDGKVMKMCRFVNSEQTVLLARDYNVPWDPHANREILTKKQTQDAQDAADAAAAAVVVVANNEANVVVAAEED